jgi:hypothetical protein
MKKPDQDIMQLEGLLEKYRFVRPVPPPAQKSILSSRKRVLVRVLRTVGAFSALYGLYLSLYFAAKKAGAGALCAKFLIAACAVAPATYGGYRLAAAIAHRPHAESPGVPPPAAGSYRWTDRITLYDGRIILGAIVSRGRVYEILTGNRIIRVPANQIKMVKPVTTSGDEPRRSGHGDGR